MWVFLGICINIKKKREEIFGEGAENPGNAAEIAGSLIAKPFVEKKKWINYLKKHFPKKILAIFAAQFIYKNIYEIQN